MNKMQKHVSLITQYTPPRVHKLGNRATLYSNKWLTTTCLNRVWPTGLVRKSAYCFEVGTCSIVRAQIWTCCCTMVVHVEERSSEVPIAQAREEKSVLPLLPSTREGTEKGERAVPLFGGLPRPFPLNIAVCVRVHMCGTLKTCLGK